MQLNLKRNIAPLRKIAIEQINAMMDRAGPAYRPIYGVKATLARAYLDGAEGDFSILIKEAEISGIDTADLAKAILERSASFDQRIAEHELKRQTFISQIEQAQDELAIQMIKEKVRAYGNPVSL